MQYIRPKDLGNFRKSNIPDICPITKQAVFDPVVDHCHQSGFVRGVICREANALLGRIENAYKRMSAGTREKSLPQMLRNMADYLEAQPASHIHPKGFIQLYKRFMRLSKLQQVKACIDAGGDIDTAHACKNARTRQKYYQKLIKANG